MQRLLLLLALCFIFAACEDSVVVPDEIPKAPENLIIALRFTEIQLNWLDASSNEEIFRVEVSVNDGPFQLLTETPTGVGTAKLLSPEVSTKYVFRVSACNTAGCSDYREAVVNTGVWSAPLISIAAIRKINATAINVALTLSSDYDANLRLVLRDASAPDNPLDVRQDPLTSQRGPIGYFFYGLVPGRTYILEAAVQNQFGTGEAEPVTFTLAGLDAPSYAGFEVAELKPTSVTFRVRLLAGTADATAVFALRSDATGETVGEGTIGVRVDSTAVSAASRPPATFTFGDLTPGARYNYSLTLTNKHGSAPPAQGSIVTPSQ